MHGNASSESPYASGTGSPPWARHHHSIQEIVNPHLYPMYAKTNRPDASNLCSCESFCCTISNSTK